MLTIILQEWKRYLRNPVFYVGLVVVFITIYSEMTPYFSYGYLNSSMQIKESNPNDADVIDGYLPYSQEETLEAYQNGFKKLKSSLIKFFDFKEAEAEEVIRYLQDEKMSIKEIARYMKKEYGYENAELLFALDTTKMASVDEVNAYISDALNKHPYSYYFSLKYADYMAVEMGFFCIIVFLFSFIFESKPDMYELLHTKPVKAGNYVLGKIFGNVTLALVVVLVITFIMNILLAYHCKDAQLNYSISDMWTAAGIMLVPSIFLISCIYMFVSVLFKNTVPAIPVLVLYMIYSNMGSIGENGLFGYNIRPMSLYIRFADLFYENNISNIVVENQCCIVALGILFCVAAIYRWKKRRL